ncbi:MAG: FliM/FliN family flagellar motor switch protein [Candidatus Caenarcaniphilales bacterium]|nr:FliM/FliN family flagellar motor switch protein [Candidatus Caenarcaniphilales bacterium]
MIKDYQLPNIAFGSSAAKTASEEQDYLFDFDWYVLNLDPIEVCKKFFELPLKGQFVGIFEDLDLNNWKGLATKWSVWEDAPDLQLRIDKKLAQLLLSQTLGERPSDENFSCHSLTDMERELLETQIAEMVNHISDAFESLEAFNPSPKTVGKFVNLIWIVNFNQEFGKIALTVPLEMVPPNKSYLQKPAVRSEEDCTQATIKVNLQVGTSRLTLADVARFEPEDFILLEESDKNYLSIIGHDEMSYAVPILIGPKKSDSKWHKIKLTESNVQEIKKDMNQILNKDVLSDFPVDVKAEFKDVKMTLKDLFSLQSGWVLPIDQIADNELYLTSQGKTIAKGELVVAGNKFGILIKEVYLSEG